MNSSSVSFVVYVEGIKMSMVTREREREGFCISTLGSKTMIHIIWSWYFVTFVLCQEFCGWI
uniref:Uncharacterized protein n=1 Tax=Cannabis sativa TaxID=3483 RepID=A0A803RAJ2_CANSA